MENLKKPIVFKPGPINGKPIIHGRQKNPTHRGRRKLTGRYRAQESGEEGRQVREEHGEGRGRCGEEGGEAGHEASFERAASGQDDRENHPQAGSEITREGGREKDGPESGDSEVAQDAGLHRCRDARCADASARWRLTEPV